MRSTRLNTALVTVLALLLGSGCLADFPSESLNVEAGGGGSDAGDGGGGGNTDGTRPDGGDGGGGSPDGFSCKPGTFVRCKSTSVAEICDSTGEATDEQDCAPNDCNASAKRCNECDPSGQPTCKDTSTLSRCADGRLVEEPCSGGCQDGACCVDGDNDRVKTCDGDCDDTNADVNPGQKRYFTQPITGTSSYDYNCDNSEEPQWPSAASCAPSGGGCTGEGWASGGSVPACGQSGSFTPCRRVGPNCVADTPTPRTQACR